MKISNKNVERLRYVERSLAKKDDHLKKVVHNVLNDLYPDFVYVIQQNGSWDYEVSNHTEVFATWGDALHQFKALVRASKLDMQECLDKENISESEQIDEDSEIAEFTIQERGDYTRYHDEIKLIKTEVI